jgi:hypothetical protein
MPPLRRLASTLASTSAPVAWTTRRSAATSPGLVVGSRPMLDSDHTIRFGWLPARPRLAVSLAANRGPTGSILPGCTRPTRSVLPSETGAGRTADQASEPSSRAQVASAAPARTVGGTRGPTATATPTLTAISTRLTSQTPPSEASDRIGRSFH